MPQSVRKHIPASTSIRQRRAQPLRKGLEVFPRLRMSIDVVREPVDPQLRRELAEEVLAGRGVGLQLAAAALLMA